MVGIITTGNHPKALWPGVKRWWGRTYSEHPVEYKDLFDMESSDQAYEEDVELTGFGLAPVKPEGDSVSYDSEAQGAVKRYTHVAYGLGWICTQEEYEDGKYPIVSKQRTKALAFSMRQTQEVVGSNVYNRAFNPGFTGADGKELLATDHPSLAGTWSNELAVAADFSEAALEDLLIQIANARNSRGLKISLIGEKLLLPTTLMFEGTRVVKSTLQSGTGNNDVNALKAMGMLPKGMAVNHYFTDPDAWFVRTNAPAGMTWYNRIETAFSADSDFDTENRKAKARMRFACGWTDPRALFGSPGA
jgi:hypothetical protein